MRETEREGGGGGQKNKIKECRRNIFPSIRRIFLQGREFYGSVIADEGEAPSPQLRETDFLSFLQMHQENNCFATRNIYRGINSE